MNQGNSELYSKMLEVYKNKGVDLNINKASDPLLADMENQQKRERRKKRQQRPDEGP